MAWMLPFGLLVFAVVCVPLRILSEEGLPRYRKLRAQLERVKTDNAELTREISRLNVEVDALRQDPEAVERIARDELGMIREDEVLFQFAPSPTTFLTSTKPLR
jgi:cell division protein FtsB